jgi:Zn-dependent protease
MYILALLSNPVLAIVFLFSIVVAVTIHEFAHAWAADRLGDDTPRLQGRVTLSPLSHLDPVGSIVFLVAGFGWGRPVMYNPMRLSRRVDELFIALAGPASNLLLAMLCFGFMTALTSFNIGGANAQFNLDVIRELARINILLAAFNMLPIPPLDGSSIIAHFWPEYRSVMGGQVGLIILLLLIFTGLLWQFVQPVIILFTQIATLFGVLAP